MTRLRSYLPPLNFITIHYAYFIVVSLVTSLIFWGSSNPRYSISYVDSLFLVISAMTEAGLNTVNLSQMTTWQQVLLWLLIIIGSSIWVSIWTVVVRKRAFERRFEEIVKRERQRSLSRRNTSLNLVPITQRLRSLGKSRTAQGAVTTPERPPTSSTVSRDVDGRILPISRPTDGRPLGTVVPPKHPDIAMDYPVGNQSKEVAPDDDVDDPSMDRREHPSPTDKPPPDAMLRIGTNDLAPRSASEHITFADHHHDAKAVSTSVAPKHAPVRRILASGEAAEPKLAPARSHDDYLRGSYKVGRNANFHGLTSEEREALGGTEYRALKLLSVVVPLYFFSWQVLGSVALGAWIQNHQPGPARANAIAPWWNGLFNGVSAFNNSGMSVLDANMIPYHGSYFVLVVMGAMILAGNTAYPIFLRLGLWCALRVLTLLTYPGDLVEWKETLAYILQYPRRVYTNLFPARQTWWLLFMLVVLNGTDWVAFEILNLGNAALEQTPLGDRVIDGLFQALAVRSGGFYVVAIPTLFIGLQVLYVIMMYISVYPVVITMRHSNVYEERSLGIYGGDYHRDEDEFSSSYSPSHYFSSHLERSQTAGVGGGGGGKTSPLDFGRALRHFFAEWHGVGAAAPPPSPSSPSASAQTAAGGGASDESRISFISHQIRGQLSHDLWWLVVAVFLITVIETKHFIEDPVTYSVFNVVFEVVSAYGCVGISIGLPDQAYSFAGGLYPGSKLVLCAVMLRGRHRGLPVALDRAVRLPGDDMHAVEEEDHRIRRSMSVRRPSGEGELVGDV